METFPAFFPLAGRRIVIAGDGEAAEAKARLFRDSPAEVVRLDRTAALDPAAYAGAGLIFVASYDAAFAEAAARAARAARVPLNVVDRPELSDFHTPSIIDRGQVVAAIGTAGAAPLLASLLRAEIETRVGAGAGRIAGLLGARREALRQAFPDLARRRAFLRAVLAGEAGRAADAGDVVLAAQRLDAALAAGWSAVGRISFIAAPAAIDLVSVRAVRALNTADILLCGPGSGPLIEAHARRDAEHWTPNSALEDAGFDDAAMADALFAQAAAGRLIAVVDRRSPDPLAASLEARGAAVERLAPAAA